MGNKSTVNKKPKVGDLFTIKSYKHDGHLHRTWKDTVLLHSDDNSVIGFNNRTLVTEDDGRVWYTSEPAIVWFDKNYWFNVVTMIKPNGQSYYSNLSTPFVFDKEALKYIDYDLDIKVFPDGRKKLLDADEYAAHSKKWGYSKDIDKILKKNTMILNHFIEQEKGPFSKDYVEYWLSRFRKLNS